MYGIGNEFFVLKSKTIIDRKPKLILCTNHIKDQGPIIYRRWDKKGTAYRDGQGWYTVDKRRRVEK